MSANSTTTPAAQNMEYLRKKLLDPSKPPLEVYPDVTTPNHIEAFHSKPPKLLRSIGKKGSRKGCFNNPCGVAVTKEGVIIIADTENHRLQMFHPDGQLLSTIIGEQGSRPHQLNHPMCLALTPDSAQNIVVTDSVNACLKVFRQDGSFMAQYTECGEFPYGVAITSDYFMLTSDLCTHSVIVLHPSGHRHHQFGEGELNHPYFIACDGDDNVVVSDSGNSAIKLFKLDGQLIKTFSLSDFKLHDDFVMLQGIHVDTSGHILIIGNSVVYICAANGRFWEVVMPEDGLHSPKNLAVCQSGKLVVTQCGHDNKHEVSVFVYDSNDFRSLRIGPLTYGQKRNS